MSEEDFRKFYSDVKQMKKENRGSKIRNVFKRH